MCLAKNGGVLLPREKGLLVVSATKEHFSILIFIYLRSISPLAMEILLFTTEKKTAPSQLSPPLFLKCWNDSGQSWGHLFLLCPYFPPK